MKKERDHTIEGEEVDADECTTAGSYFSSLLLFGNNALNQSSGAILRNQRTPPLRYVGGERLHKSSFRLIHPW